MLMSVMEDWEMREGSLPVRSTWDGGRWNTGEMRARVTTTQIVTKIVPTEADVTNLPAH